MGCAPSKSVEVYGQDKVCRDQDTCSTFVPSLMSSESTLERPSPRVCMETSSGRQTFLSVPTRDVRGRSVSQSSWPESSSEGTSAGPSSLSYCEDQPRSPSPLLRRDTEEYGTS